MMAAELSPDVQVLWDALLSCELEAVRQVLKRDKTEVKSLCETLVPTKLLWQDCSVDLNDNVSAVHYLAMVGNRSLLSEVLRRAGQINLNVISSRFSWTPLHYAVQGGHLSAVHILIDNGADPNKPDISGASSLHLAIANGFPQVVEYLIDKGSNVNIQDGKGETPLHVCLGLLCATKNHLAPKQRTKLVTMLIEAGASVRIMNQIGDTPLHLALRYNHGSEIFSLLMKAPGACDSLEVVNDSGHIPLQVADDVSSLEMLLLNGSNVNFQGPDGRTALHMHASNPGVVNVLLDHEGDVHIRDRQGQTPVHVALSDDGVPMECICHLLMSMSDVNVKDNAGNTPLHLVCKMKSKDASSIDSHDRIIDLLINQGAQVNLQNKKGQCPLHVALRLGHYEKALKLLQFGSNLDMQDGMGLAPRQITPRWILKWLSQQQAKLSDVNAGVGICLPVGMQNSEENVATVVTDSAVVLMSGSNNQVCATPDCAMSSPTPAGCMAPPNTAASTGVPELQQSKCDDPAINHTSFLSSTPTDSQVLMLRKQLANLQDEVSEFKEMLEQCTGPDDKEIVSNNITSNGSVDVNMDFLTLQDEVDTVRSVLEDVYEDC